MVPATSTHGIPNLEVLIDSRSLRRNLAKASSRLDHVNVLVKSFRYRVLEGAYPLHFVDGVGIVVELGVHDPLCFGSRYVEVDPVSCILDVRGR